MVRTSIKLDLDVGELVSNAGRAREAISALTDAMKKAEEEKRWDDHAKLSFEHNKLKNKTSGFEQDIQKFANNPHFQTQTANGTAFKVDAEYAGLIKAQIEAMKQLTAQYTEAVRDGDVATARELSPQIEKQQDDFHKLVEESSRPTGMRKQDDAINSIGFGKVANAITDGLSRWIGSLDRSSIINKQGSGDIVGANIEDIRRKANIAGGVGESFGSIAGSIIGSIIPGINNEIGSAIGGMLGSGIGKLIGLPMEVKANTMATNEAYSQNWEQQAPASMELSAILGRNGGSIEENTKNLRAAFAIAASAAADFGYSAEEGIDTIKKAAQQGLSESSAVSAARNVFKYERGTGADRSELLSLETTSRRYGVNDSLGMAWAGRQASGMSTGQYNEYLRAMQRVFEEGINKGFVRGSKEMVEDLTLVNQMAGGSELWKGEQGQQRLSQMNSALESTTNLASATDILAFRGAQKVVKDMSADEWKKLTDLDNNGSSDIKRSGDYTDAMILIERGLTPKLFNSQMSMINNAEGGGRTGSIERMRQMYGLSYTNSSMIYDQWRGREESGEPLTQKEIEDIINRYGKEPPKNDSTELEISKSVKNIEKYMAQIGQHYTDEKQTEIHKALIEMWLKATGMGVNDEDKPTTQLKQGDTTPPSLPGKPWGPQVANPRSQAEAAADAFQASLIGKNEQIARITPAMNGYFSPGTGYLKTEAERIDNLDREKIQGIIINGINSGDTDQLRQAKEVLDLLSKLSKDERDSLNKSNEINALASSNDISALLSALMEIIENTRATASNTGETRIVEVP